MPGYRVAGPAGNHEGAHTPWPGIFWDMNERSGRIMSARTRAAGARGEEKA